MITCYNRLWKMLIERGITKTELVNVAGISTNAIAKMGKNKTVSMFTLIKICKALSCKIEDVVEFKAGDENND